MCRSLIKRGGYDTSYNALARCAEACTVTPASMLYLLPRLIVLCYLCVSVGCMADGPAADITGLKEWYISTHVKVQRAQTKPSFGCRRAAKTNNFWNRLVRKGSIMRRVCMYGEYPGQAESSAFPNP